MCKESFNYGAYEMTSEEAINKLEYMASCSPFADIKLACKIGADAISTLQGKKED